jgi:hypothetical protein
MTAHAVAGAVQLAAVTATSDQVAETFRAFLRLGLEVAGGKNRWADEASTNRTEIQTGR